jgi:multidrug resistance efflux pump
VLTAQQALNDLHNNLDVRRAEAMVEIVAARKELDKAQKRSTSKDYVRGSQDQIDTARANYILAQKDYEDTEEMYNGVRSAENELSTANALTVLAAARQRRDSALANLNYLLLKPNPLDVGEIEAQLALAEAKLANAEQKLAQIKDGPDAEQVALAEARLKNAMIQQAAAQSSLQDLELSAPFDATVVSVETTPGTFVQPGASVVQLADVANWMVETTDLTERDIARISLGMPAVIHFDALPDVELIGRVERIDLLGQNRQGDIVYTVRLKLDQTDPHLRWNMTSSLTFLAE